MTGANKGLSRAGRIGFSSCAGKSAKRAFGLKTRASIQTRIGIATGLVVVGDLIGSGASQEQAVIGETPNLAARHQDSAFFPFIGQLERASGFGRDDTPSMRLAGRHFPEERLEMPLPHQAQTVLTIINRAGGYERALGRFERVAHVRLDRAVLEAERQAPVAVL